MWFLSTVCSHVCCKINFLCKCFVTLAALMCFPLAEYVHMHCKLSFPYKSFATLAALIWFLPSVYSHMIFKTTYL